MECDASSQQIVRAPLLAMEAVLGVPDVASAVLSFLAPSELVSARGVSCATYRASRIAALLGALTRRALHLEDLAHDFSAADAVTIDADLGGGLSELALLPLRPESFPASMLTQFFSELRIQAVGVPESAASCLSFRYTGRPGGNRAVVADHAFPVESRHRYDPPSAPFLHVLPAVAAAGPGAPASRQRRLGLRMTAYFEVALSPPGGGERRAAAGGAPFAFDDEQGCVAVGLARRGFPLSGVMPGWDSFSVGYHSDDGHVFNGSGIGRHFGPTFGRGDVVGCGIVYLGTSHCPLRLQRRRREPEGSGAPASRSLAEFVPGDSPCVFFTLNGALVGHPLPIDVRHAWHAVIGMDVPDLISVNFGAAPFRFPLREAEAGLLRASSLVDKYARAMLPPSPPPPPPPLREYEKVRAAAAAGSLEIFVRDVVWKLASLRRRLKSRREAIAQRLRSAIPPPPAAHRQGISPPSAAFPPPPPAAALLPRGGDDAGVGGKSDDLPSGWSSSSDSDSGASSARDPRALKRARGSVLPSGADVSAPASAAGVAPASSVVAATAAASLSLASIRAPPVATIAGQAAWSLSRREPRSDRWLQRAERALRGWRQSAPGARHALAAARTRESDSEESTDDEGSSEGSDSEGSESSSELSDASSNVQGSDADDGGAFSEDSSASEAEAVGVAVARPAGRSAFGVARQSLWGAGPRAPHGAGRGLLSRMLDGPLWTYSAPEPPLLHSGASLPAAPMAAPQDFDFDSSDDGGEAGGFVDGNSALPVAFPSAVLELLDAPQASQVPAQPPPKEGRLESGVSVSASSSWPAAPAFGADHAPDVGSSLNQWMLRAPSAQADAEGAGSVAARGVAHAEAPMAMLGGVSNSVDSPHLPGGLEAVASTRSGGVLDPDAVSEGTLLRVGVGIVKAAAALAAAGSVTVRLHGADVTARATAFPVALQVPGGRPEESS